jgi:hypothetical protein
MSLKKKIAKWLKITAQDIEEMDGYQPKKFGESRSVEYEIDGLVKTFCKVTEWANGEGFDISFETEENVKLGTWENKRIEIHTDELECLFACLNELKYFEN